MRAANESDALKMNIIVILAIFTRLISLTGPFIRGGYTYGTRTRAPKFYLYENILSYFWILSPLPYYVSKVKEKRRRLCKNCELD